MKNSIVSTLILLMISISVSGQTNIFPSTGNVGIGTTTPQSLFNIYQGPGNATTGTPSLTIGGTSNYPSLELGIKGAYDGMISTYGNDLHIYAGNWRSAGATATENHNISFYTSQTSSTNWNTPKMYLRYDGNLGIGTTSPLYKLQVNSNASSNFRLVSNGSTTPNPTIDIYDNVNGTEFVLSPSAGKVDLFTYSNHSLALGTANTERMRIDNFGNVDIGTTTPDAKLAVKGTVHAQEVKVDLNGAVAPDYVFEPDYKLTTLEEIKAYIAQHKHLPEIPSAKEMEANGINLGEMNLRLLKKIEEMTLHILQQEERIQKLEELNSKKHEN